MRVKIYIVVVLLIAPLFMIGRNGDRERGCEKHPQNDLSAEGLRGKVKTTATEYYDLVNYSDTVPVLNMIVTLCYDSSGMWTFKKTEFMESPGKGGFRTENRMYNAKGKVVSELSVERHGAYDTVIITQINHIYGADGLLLRSDRSYAGCAYTERMSCDVEYKYDTSGHCVEESSCYYLKRSAYDNKGNCIKMTYVDKHFNHTSTINYVYDKKCRLISSIATGGDTIISAYKYDKKGRRIKTLERNDAQKYASTTKTGYDKHSNQIRIEITGLGRRSLSTTSFEYDNAGNWLKFIEHRDHKEYGSANRKITYF